MSNADAAEPSRSTVSARHAALLFGGLGLISGAVSTQVSDVLATDLWPSPLTGVAFGAAFCLALYSTVRPKWLLLAVAFLAVQLAWRAAVETAVLVDDTMRQSSSPNVGLLLDSALVQVQQQIDTGTQSNWRFDQNMLLPGLIAGAVGAAGTWVGAAFCAARLRRFAALALPTAIAGLLLASDTLVLFPVWQAAVAASIGFMLLPPRRSIP